MKKNIKNIAKKSFFNKKTTKNNKIDIKIDLYKYPFMTENEKKECLYEIFIKKYSEFK